MFYATKIKSVLNGAAIDVNGKRLSFIGYLPVKAGDTVFTDGRVIFGNAPPKGSSAVFDLPSGIPVLADDLQGYFTLNAIFKDYRIAGTDWIVNDKKKFGHGDVEIDSNKIIDAGYSDDGDLYVATDGQYRENHTAKYNHHLFIGHHSGEAWQHDGTHWVNADIVPYVGEEITLGVEADSVDASAVIYKNDEPTSEFNLKTFADMVMEKCFDARDEIMSRSANMGKDGNLLPEPPDGVNWMQQPPPPESFIAAVDARILTFKFDQQGEWDAIITASAYGYCFPFLNLKGSVLEASFDSATPEFDDYLPDCISSLERFIFTNKYFPFLTLEKYPSFSGTRKSGGQYTEAFKKWCVDAIAYYIPLVRFTFFEWYPVAFGASMLIHVRNAKIVTVMQTRRGIGHEVMTYSPWDEVRHYSAFDSSFEISSPAESTDWQFPIGDGLFLNGNGIGIKGIFDSNGEKLSDPPNFNLGRFYYPLYPFFCYYRDDAVAEELYKQIGAPDISAIHRHYIWFAGEYYYYQKDLRDRSKTAQHVQQHPDEFFSLPALKPYRFLTEFYDEKAKTDDSRDVLYRFNPSCEKLKGGGLLFGIYGEKLYLKTSDDWQQVGDGFKNFRLREMKKISKAKR